MKNKILLPLFLLVAVPFFGQQKSAETNSNPLENTVWEGFMNVPNEMPVEIYFTKE